ncbi:MAG: hypothetical protein Q8916_10375 [Bacteroidota bacterium]|nr:hypothetical protein [Bacteroidota bacterium]MDP4230794.1 hypothetical protein [Bacteroidota bacterium]MDP4235909.1 hypothetical protein [Bacteroidota bacterium]
MLRKLNLKMIGWIGGLTLALLVGILVKQAYFTDKCERYMTIGGKSNPCQCTQRIER